MPGDVQTALAGANLDSFGLDRAGRIVIHDPALAAKIKELGAVRDIEDAASGNGLCCGNGSCLSDELVAMLNKVVSRPGRIG